MNYKLLKQAAEVIKPKIDWNTAQKADTVGFISPAAETPETLDETKPLPAPTGPYKAPKPVKSRKTKQSPKQTSSVITPKSDTPETPLPMTPGYASLYNEELKNEETPRYKSQPIPEGSPWHPGYSRVPNTIDPNKKNPKLHDEEAFQKIFGPRHSDWRQDNPAGWFNFSTAAKGGMIDSAPTSFDRYNPLIKGPFTTIDDTWDYEKIHPYDAVIKFPHQDDVLMGYSRALTPEETESSFLGIAPVDLFLPYSPITEAAGAHEGTHNIAHTLSNDPRTGIVPYAAGMSGLYPWHAELPTVAVESTYNTNGKFVPELTPTIPPRPMRSEDDEYIRNIMPTADSMRVAMSGEIDPTSINSDAGPAEFANSVSPGDLYNKGIRYWNGPHDKDRGAVSLDQLRFVPDTPVGWYYDRFGNKRLSGGELINYNDLYGDTKPKDMDQLSPNTRRFFKNLGQAPQAWIDAVDHPEEYAAAQDKARRIMFPLLRKDISGMFRDGDVESIKLLRDYQHPAFQMMIDLVDGKNFFDLTDQERSDIMDKVEALYPELRLDPVATPSWLVHAQKEFGLLPEMGVTGVRTLDQYDDIARYDAYYRALDEYLRRYGSQGGGYYGI